MFKLFLHFYYILLHLLQCLTLQENILHFITVHTLHCINSSPGKLGKCSWQFAKVRAIFMLYFTCSDKSAETLEALICQHVVKGTKILTDGWASYRRVERLGRLFPSCLACSFLVAILLLCSLMDCQVLSVLYALFSYDIVELQLF